jgi:hypothetical protein
MAKLTRRERSALNKARFAQERGGRAEMRGGETTHRYDRESEEGSPRLTRVDRARIRAKTARNRARGGRSEREGWSEADKRLIRQYASDYADGFEESSAPAHVIRRLDELSAQDDVRFHRIAAGEDA